MMVSAKKLIQGSVIYMKKMRVSKRGFTLTEIIVVVAIIVIVASAAFVGVAVTLENAKKKRKDLNETHGRDPTGKELFEAGAWDEIDQWTTGVAQFFGIHYYTPSDGGGENTESVTPTPTVAGGGSVSSDNTSSTNTPTPLPTNTPTPQHTNTPTPEPTKATTSGTGFARITSASYPSGIELSGSDSQNPNNGGVCFKLKQDMTSYKKVTITVTCADNTFNHGWNVGNNPAKSNGGHTLTYELEYNPYYKDPFKSGAELHPQWDFDDASGKHVNVTVTVVYS